MSGFDIQSKVKSGLAKATTATGSGELIYLVKKTVTAGTPLNPGTSTSENIELKNAIFKTININQFTDSAIIAGDRELICDSDVIVKVNDIIKQGSQSMIIVSVKSPTPSGVLLVQKCIVRTQ